MKIAILPIVSALHDDNRINEETNKLIKEIEQLGDYTFELSGKDTFYNADISVILVQSGGSESYFLEMEQDLHAPYYLLTYGTNNSLAASMEILSYLKGKGEKAEILHGSASFIESRLQKIMNKEVTTPVRLGVVGKPSDWLIASSVNYEQCLDMLNVALVDVTIEELVTTYQTIELDGYEDNTKLVFDPKEINDAKKLSKALEVIKVKYKLDGLTLRCFDLLGKIHTTGCLGLALLNRDNSIGTCEGDIPAMLSMHILKEVTGKPGFQANPSRIDSDKNEIIFAHCTLPLDMADEIEVMTHYESGIGVAFRGKMRETDITIFKLSTNLKDYYVAEGTLTRNLEEGNLCRTQIAIALDDVNYFLTNPYGNHHIIVYGKHKDKLKEYMRSL